jgi:hypothetical protein
VTPPDGTQPRWSAGRPDPLRPSTAAPDREDEARLAPHEQARIDEAVVRVARRGRGPLVVAVLVVGAFILGLVRPWDWLAGDPAVASRPDPGGAAGAAPAGAAPAGASRGPGDDGSGASREPGSGEAAAPLEAPTCGYPTGWRTASISLWAGARAQIWTAALAVTAAGPDDPAIPFHAIASEMVEAIGWCAPVSGPERPPLTAIGVLFRLRDGLATEVAVDRLQPVARDALGELWLPRARAPGPRSAWPAGRYVIRLATPTGSYVRYLGLEVGVPARAEPSPGDEPPTPGGAPSPGGAASPPFARPSLP